jgi:hypothetical protein
LAKAIKLYGLLRGKGKTFVEKLLPLAPAPTADSCFRPAGGTLVVPPGVSCSYCNIGERRHSLLKTDFLQNHPVGGISADFNSHTDSPLFHHLRATIYSLFTTFLPSRNERCAFRLHDAQECVPLLAQQIDDHFGGCSHWS